MMGSFEEKEISTSTVGSTFLAKSVSRDIAPTESQSRAKNGNIEKQISMESNLFIFKFKYNAKGNELQEVTGFLKILKLLIGVFVIFALFFWILIFTALWKGKCIKAKLGSLVLEIYQEEKVDAH